METKNSSDADNNVLTNFHPMPKQFMVWDKEDGVPLFDGKVFTLRELISEFGHVPSVLDGCEICQSTSLFDKDGKEIFEGSIIRGKKYVYVVTFAYGEFYAIHDSVKVGYIESSLYKLLYHEGGAKVIGHILSNPELLEERDA